MDPPCMIIRNSVGAVACIQSLHTPLAKARGWVRQILNSRGLEESLLAIHQHQKLVSTFYGSESIMCHPEDMTALLAIVRSLKVYSFNFTVDSNALNNIPHWFYDLLSDQNNSIVVDKIRRSTSSSSLTSTASASTLASNHATANSNIAGGTQTSNHIDNYTGSSQQVSAGPSTIDTFLSLFEQSFDVVIDQVDAAATLAAKFISDKLESNESMAGMENLGPALRWRTPFFGSPLKALILDESRCSYARLEPRLGIPAQAIALLDFVESSITTEGLFRLKGSAQEMEALRERLERCEAIPAGTSPHIAVQCLLQWLYDLEEPLLGYEHYDAIQSCMSLEDECDRVRNLSLLALEAPWWHLPLLLRVMQVLEAACLPHNTAMNGLNIVVVSVVATPLLLRPRPLGSALYARSRSLGQCVERDPEERDREHLAAAAAGSTIVELLISRRKEVFHPLQQYLQQINESFMSKCNRVRTLQESLAEGLDHFPAAPPPHFGSEKARNGDVNGEQEDGHREGSPEVSRRAKDTAEKCLQHLLLATQIWKALEAVERHRVALTQKQPEPIGSFTVETDETDEVETAVEEEKENVNLPTSSEAGPTPIHPDGGLPEQPMRQADSVGMTAAELCASPRWDLCGFVGVKEGGNPLKEFHSSGLLAAQSLLGFLSRYGDKASLLVLDFVQKRLKYCSLSQICCQLTTFVADALRLLPTPDSPEAPLSIAYIARKPSWPLLSEERCFQEVFDIALLTFDDLWRHYTDRIGHMPTHDTVQLCLFSCRTLLDELVKISPRNTEQLWQLWTEQRVNRQQSLVEAHMQLPLTVQRPRPSRPSEGARGRSESNGDDRILTPKVYCGLLSHVVGGSEILTAHHIDELEPALPVVHQCCDWTLIYRMSRDGASLSTFLQLAKRYSRSDAGRSKGKDNTSNPTLLVIRDSRGTVFGGFAPDTWRDMGERYYGNGTAAVWTFVNGGLQFFPSSQTNTYFMLTNEESIGMGGGGNFALFLDSELNHGSSGPCATYSSPCLASAEEFICTACELFVLRPASFHKE